MLREGPQNCDRNGLQQSYGDHNRLLMLGLDKLLAGDLEWYRGRLDSDDPVAEADLVEVLHRAGRLDLTRDLMVALWLAGSLHDCGMLAGRGAVVDVEDGVVIGGDVIDALCPGDLVQLATFALRHHDYIKDVFLGEVPAALVADELDTLDDTLRPVALAVLGLVQVAGAASLGIGRLTAFRSRIFHGCIDGTTLDDRSRGIEADTPALAGSRNQRRRHRQRSRRCEPRRPRASRAVPRPGTGAPMASGARQGRRRPTLRDTVGAQREMGADDRGPCRADGADLERPAHVETALNGSRLLIVGV